MRNLTFSFCTHYTSVLLSSIFWESYCYPLGMENGTFWHKKLWIFIWLQLYIIYPDLGTQITFQNSFAFISLIRSLHLHLWRSACVLEFSVNEEDSLTLIVSWELLGLEWLFSLILNGMVNIESDTFNGMFLKQSQVLWKLFLRRCVD